jgi:hypothetical protein
LITRNPGRASLPGFSNVSTGMLILSGYAKFKKALGGSKIFVLGIYPMIEEVCNAYL